MLVDSRSVICLISLLFLKFHCFNFISLHALCFGTCKWLPGGTGFQVSYEVVPLQEVEVWTTFSHLPGSAGRTVLAASAPLGRLGPQGSSHSQTRGRKRPWKQRSLRYRATSPNPRPDVRPSFPTQLVRKMRTMPRTSGSWLTSSRACSPW